MDFGLSGIMEELMFGLASGVTVATAAMYSEYKSISRNLEGAPILTVGTELTNTLRSQSNLPYAAVTGRVFPMDQDKILLTAAGMPAVVSKLRMKELRFMDTFSNIMVSSDGNITPALNYVPFALSNPNDAAGDPASGTYLMVDDISSGEFDQLLTTAKSTYVPTRVTFSGLIAAFMRGFHSVGIETAESVLPVGTVITVIGEVTKMSGGEGNSFRISKSSAGGTTTPYILTTKNIIEVKSDIHAQATICKVISFLCGCFTLMMFYALGKKWLPRFRLRRVQRFVQRQRTPGPNNTEGLHETQICLACLGKPREVALFPCGHVCLCADCSLLIEEKCPVCRETVVDIAPVFLS